MIYLNLQFQRIFWYISREVFRQFSPLLYFLELLHGIHSAEKILHEFEIKLRYFFF